MSAQKSPRRKCFSAREKLAILDETRTWTVAQVAAAHEVSRQTVAAWRVSEASLRHRQESVSRQHGSASSNSNVVQAPADDDSSSTPMLIATAPPSPQANRADASSGRASAMAETTEEGTTTQPVQAPSPPPQPQQLEQSNADAAAAPASSTLPPSPMRRSVRIAYAGLRGTVADVATQQFFPLLQVGVASSAASAVHTVGYPHVIDAMDAVVHRETDYCVVPTHWLLSLSASFALAEFTARRLCIVAEIMSKPQLRLSAVPGTALRDCRCVLSDAPLLQAHDAMILDMEAQCGETIVRQAAWDSAGACLSVKEERARNVAVLATTQAARDAGLHILVDGIHTADADASARFLVLGQSGCAPISPRESAACTVRAVRKTTLLASVFNEPAWLATILRAFADASVPVLGIQTRLLAPWSTSRMHAHQVLLSFLTAEEAAPQSAPHCLLLEQLGALTASLHVLGTYFSMAAVPASDARAAPS